VGPRGDFAVLKTVSMDFKDLSFFHPCEGGADDAQTPAIDGVEIFRYIQNAGDVNTLLHTEIIGICLAACLLRLR
jgi:hypothetical protein